MGYAETFQNQIVFTSDAYSALRCSFSDPKLYSYYRIQRRYRVYLQDYRSDGWILNITKNRSLLVRSLNPLPAKSEFQ